VYVNTLNEQVHTHHSLKPEHIIVYCNLIVMMGKS